METIKGTVEHIVFRNNNNGYTVAHFDIDGNLVTVVGNFDELNHGEYLKLTGYWTEHKNYGDQFSMETYAMEIPTSTEGITRYLASGIIPGIGEKTAKAIVKHFGEETLDILDNHPDRLSEIKGIGKKTLEGIKEVYHEQREIRQIMIQIQDYGISAAWAMKLYKTYQSETISVLLNNPYQMIDDIRGIGFKIADQIANQLGFEPNSPSRILAGINYALGACYNRGNTFMTETELIQTSSRILGVDEDEITSQLGELILFGKIIQEEVSDQRVYYPRNLYEAEDNAALIMARISQGEYKIPDVNIAKKIKAYEKDMDITLDNKQSEAIAAAMENGVIVITGGPGTGKTTIINGIVRIFKDLGFKTVLSAPTGRAAKRITETTGHEAKTIHRLLEYEYSENDDFPSFSKDEANPLEVDAIIVDESSMIDILLMNSLLMAIQPGTRLILVGDADQLPSVGPGNVLKDIIESGAVKVVSLERIYRQSEESMISVNAYEINQGNMPDINNDSDFLFLNKNDGDKLLRDILKIVTENLPLAKGFDSFQDIQVISPMKNGKVGVISLNRELQAVLNPPNPGRAQREFGTVIYREGDKVMQIKNNYRLKWEDTTSYEQGEGIYNGDIGILEEIDEGQKTFSILFNDGKRVDYDFDQMDEITHAYAMTVHKSQGSEFPVVVMPIVGGPPLFLNRKLLYTAVTRAKKMLVLMGNQYVFRQMIKSAESQERQTAYRERIISYINHPML
ncbi:ATP-dependent RecD-like DNA helicase [Acetobacterium fimetarium]|uniref:ATP-dependent RecD2 DNA helicase n=1 Tax=Acetobacterium fimetarium TaxID=52691 RepID=A0ABR6WYJ1_9FIRM|nr:ATP-dependent RecD-like DNA helicase [Acetobacterium fimetarium]MBC3805682.1 ATP-dependent RecD-like DNA helicase [Acetobacterium fimetarium]